LCVRGRVLLVAVPGYHFSRHSTPSNISTICSTTEDVAGSISSARCGFINGAQRREERQVIKEAIDMSREPIVWEDVIIDFKGRHIRASYSESYGLITVNSFRGSSKTARLGALSAKFRAEIVLREMAADGKA